MLVSELVKQLKECKQNAIVQLEFVKITYSGGCGTCGYGAHEDKEVDTLELEYCTDLETRVVLGVQNVN